uniref:DUF4585 domain-containing protein n=1 Tax=Sphaeramia orbicularis TaxID=375764 RepID=A0A673AF78_9TELE
MLKCHSDGGYSDTSSGGSFLDETDREVSNLTDRAFRSLCIGDEAVYNDSDLSASPCFQRDRQLAFSQGGQDREDREREELKRAAHESFSRRVQQYGQDWIHGGTYGAEIHQDPQWGVYGERRTQGRVSATFQHSFAETSQQEQSLKDDQLSFLSNGATELSSQQRRSRSRVSSLIRAFNSEGQRDGMGMDGKLRDWNDETSWDKSALMSIERELSEFSTSYQQNINTGYFPSAGLFSSQNSNFYSSEVAAVQMNSASSFMRSSHSKHSMSTQVNCNSNFFIHSEFSPFKVWRNYNRFPFQQGEVSGFMHHSEFPKWYQTPMYKELSLEAQQQGPTAFQERGIGYSGNTLAPVVAPTHPRSTSTSTVMQKASALEKRCESELAGHYPHRKRTQSLGANRLPSQRPSTASPSSEMSRRVRDTLSSVKALQQKIKTMTEQNITSQPNQDGVYYNNDNFYPYGNNTGMMAPNVVSSNTSTTPFNISQLLTPLVHAPQEPDVSEVHQYAVSPQPVEHPPVRAESRGATPDVRMSSYKSRATSLLFNLKDNRKRVKSTYSPTRFKGLEMPEKNKQASVQESRDTMIEIPDFSEMDISNSLVEKSRVDAALHQYENQYHSTGLLVTALNSQPVNPYMGQNPEYYSSDQHRAQMQGEMAHQFGFTEKLPPENKSLQEMEVKNAQGHKERNKSPLKYLMNKGSDEQVVEVNQLTQSIHQVNNPPLQTTTSSSVNKPRQRSLSRDRTINQKPKEFSPQGDGLPYMDKNTYPQQAAGPMYNSEASTTSVRKDVFSANEMLQQEKLATQRDETKASHHSRAKQSQEAAEAQRIKHVLEESRASLAEEERRAAQREEERRVKEREEQRKAKQVEEEKAAQREKELKANQREEERKIKELEEKRRAKIEEERKAKLKEEERMKALEERRRIKQKEEERAALEEQQKRAALIEEQKRRTALMEEQQRKAALMEEQKKKTVLEEQQRRAALEEQKRKAALIEEQKRKASFATSAADLADVRGLFDSDRPESACSYSSDVSRSLGRPPVVPPKSEKALRRAQRLTTRRMKKELSKAVAESPAGGDKPIHEVSTTPSSSTEVRSSSQKPVTTPHFSAPVSLAHAPTSGSESSYPQSYPVTQRKVLQDIGSGQYFVVDVPVPVKTKTFFDPETGKYVQLNVRESGRSTSQPQPQQTYPQPQLKPQMQVKSQQQPVTQASPAGKSYTPHSYPQGYQSATVPSVPTHQSTPGVPASVTFSQDQQPIRENSNYRYHSYSPEKTPYMDTVNDADKTYNTVYNTHGSHEVFPQSDTNSQLAGSSVCENDNSAHSRYQSRDIISMSELEDFMEVSDW